ncbi:hypothetical protein ACWD4B_23965 [Streptomyces sp. NPDC002536]
MADVLELPAGALPGAAGLVGCLRERAVIPVFSSTLITTAFAGQVR